MSVLRTVVSKSGSSVAKITRLGAVFVAIPGLLALQGCSIANPLASLPDMDMPFEMQKSSSYSAVDRRIWRINDASRFSGLVIADEPQAAQVARQILEAGGNAADAATGLYFALSVTYPGAAGLGGGGSCLYSAPGALGVEQVDFPVRLPAGGGQVAVPGNIRGFAYISINYGRMPWRDVVGPAARLAGSGAVMSRATQRQLVAARGVSLPDGMTSGGKLVQVGREYRQPGLAATVGLIQGAGAGALYNGDISNVFIADAQKAGGAVTREDMRAYKVRGRAAVRSTFNEKNLFVRDGSDEENNIWKSAVDGTAAANRDMNSGTATDAGSSSFVVADSEGGAVACVVSLGGVFGSGKSSRSSGIFFSSAQDTSSLSNIAVVKHSKVGLIYAAASGGGASGLFKSAAMVAEVPLSKQASLGGAMRNNQSSGFDAVNALYCVGGIADKPRSCRFGTEPASHGYGLMAQ